MMQHGWKSRAVSPGESLKQLARGTVAGRVEAEGHDEGLALQLGDEGGGAVGLKASAGVGVAHEGGVEKGWGAGGSCWRGGEGGGQSVSGGQGHWHTAAAFHTLTRFLRSLPIRPHFFTVGGAVVRVVVKSFVVVKSLIITLAVRVILEVFCGGGGSGGGGGGKRVDSAGKKVTKL
jgi:hypothetical protein